MAENKICITTDCVCDLPDEILRKNNVDLIYFYIRTDSGRFKDVDEITAQNVFDYLRNGGSKTITEAPPSDEFVSFFTEKLRNYEHVIHIAISSKISKSVSNAEEAVKKMGDEGKNVHIIDSGHLSTGIAHLVLRAAEMVREGNNTEQIVAEVMNMRDRVSTSFMADNTDFLYLNGQVSKGIHKICTMFKIHPVLSMQDGYLKLKACHVGNYKKSAVRYIRAELKSGKKIKSNMLFITHAGCSTNDIKMVKRYVASLMKFDEVFVTKASATISSNSGPRTFGLLYIKEK
ncbi:MAG: DegV family protein [Oscillospiraceae bacterium]|nr:DegV family protein [Oscillospiraceae bacterium]